ncbi:glycosyl transferase family 1 [Nocardioides psychrotolerans]|uniref:Glycosyltransferase involved in cell wall bisynthesis n=1 Tax=Nocardioides psychrotolerans TaxID=1005945 RepID=A0A1I3FX18_9ACTN|nr:glycosyltransferase family 4 protein [Nocardioides psychrotolerans]GEP37354.1 glycosyl transferase family 1 [Nocardioides psychrotolerans]SFI15729.1 Glycosyltransferase involved in cell wall bisynthesis [Nocardioides psychrotolerans]
MRIAMLSYRSKSHCGGQGIYLRHLSRELTRLGHTVEVFSGQPYPDLDEGVALTKVPSLDLYREPDPFRVPQLKEFRDLIDVEEFATMCAAGFPEPKTFSKRVARLLAERVGDFDIAHDNQVLGYGMLDIEKLGLPLITTLHHPITFDRRIDLAQTRNPWRKVTLRRWYGFLRMQGKVARQARKIMTPSETSKRDIATDFGVDPAKMQVILLGVDDGFKPPTKPRVPGRIMAMASADAPMKGIATLLEAFAKLRTERDVELILVTKPQAGGRTEKLIEKLSIGDAVRFVHGVSEEELVDLMGSAELACVPSLYEGFSLPTAELMACATPLVVSRAGAIPEVVGPDGLCAEVVTPGDVGELKAAIEGLLDDPAKRVRMGAAGRQRVEELFSWRAVAATVAQAYGEVIADFEHERAAGASTAGTERKNLADR